MTVCDVHGVRWRVASCHSGMRVSCERLKVFEVETVRIQQVLFATALSTELCTWSGCYTGTRLQDCSENIFPMRTANTRQ
jgi:hypothetical protein